MQDWFLSIKHIAQSAVEGNLPLSSESEYAGSSAESEDSLIYDIQNRGKNNKTLNNKKVISKCVSDYHVKGLLLKETKKKIVFKNMKVGTQKYSLVIRPERPIYNQMSSSESNLKGLSIKHDENITDFKTLLFSKTSRVISENQNNFKKTPVLQTMSDNIIIVNEDSIFNNDDQMTLTKKDNTEEMIFGTLKKSLISNNQNEDIVYQKNTYNLNQNMKLKNEEKYIQYHSNPSILEKSPLTTVKRKKNFSKSINNVITNNFENLEPLIVEQHYIKNDEIYYIIKYSTNIKLSLPLETCVKNKNLVNLIFKYNNSKKSNLLIKKKKNYFH